jgi:peptide/nickel transport system permease protein
VFRLVWVTFLGVQLANWAQTVGAVAVISAQSDSAALLALVQTASTLPAVALALAYLAYVARVVRAATREELGREHVETARARGLSSSQIVRRHVVRNAMIPIVTVSGLTVAGLLAATVVVERAFNLDGLGSLLVDAVVRKDVAVAQAVSLVLVTAFVVINTLVDLLSRVLDPRVDLETGT